MAEKTFKSPNFYEREIDLSGTSETVPFGTPSAVIGASEKGPAFVPVTVANFSEFVQKFGDINQHKPAVYAAEEFLKNRSSLMFLRVLGAGSNDTLTDVSTTESQGTVKNAGYFITGSVQSVGPSVSAEVGGTKFLTAIHTLQSDEAVGDRSLTDNDSITFEDTGVESAALVRAVIQLANDTRLLIFEADKGTLTVSDLQNSTTVNAANCASSLSNQLMLVFSSSAGSSFSNDDSLPGIRKLIVSLNPSDTNYVSKVLNTDATKFGELKHYLNLHFPIESNIANITSASSNFGTGNAEGDNEFKLFSGSLNANGLGNTYQSAYGKFNTRFTFAKTSKYISQPFGKREFDLFHFESIDDGEAGNAKVKIVISDLKTSLDENNKFGTFSVQVRDISDTDINPMVLEEFRNCNLNPSSPDFIVKKIGDRRISYNFDSPDRSERRLVVTGIHLNKSKYVRVIPTNELLNKKIPVEALPFGFRGMDLLSLGAIVNSDTGTATNTISSATGDNSAEMLGLFNTSIVPPVPMRLKITRGQLTTPTTLLAFASPNERTNGLFCWGVKFERITDITNPNVGLERNLIIDNLAKFHGIDKQEVLTSGDDSDSLNNNKFSLAKIVLGFETLADLNSSTESVQNQMRTAVYLRDGIPDHTDSYRIADKITSSTKLITFASLLSTPAVFNQYSQYMKFSNFMGGGFDGLNILDKDLGRLNDKSTSQESGGCAEASYVSPGFGVNISGLGTENNNFNSYKVASEIMTDPVVVNHNLLAVPGIRDSALTNIISQKVKSFGLSMYVMDLPSYTDGSIRLFDDSVGSIDLDKTIQKLQNRFIDNNYVASYYPDVFIDDRKLNRRVKVPASVAAMSALGFSDRVSFAWFAPAGFNRAALDFVRNSTFRLSVNDRDKLYEARVNPIAVFPRQGFVIYGQKTMQIAKSALDRVNVRRLMLEIKRAISNIARQLIFEKNDAQTRSRFITSAQIILSSIQSQAGIEKFQVVMDETNNTQSDIDQLKMNGRVVVIPTRVFEFIAIDFIVTPSGVEFA